MTSNKERDRIAGAVIDVIGEKWPKHTINKPTTTVDLGKVSRIELLENIAFAHSGIQNEVIPRGLLLDVRLTPIERNAWLVFKMLLDSEGFSAPKYQDLQSYLSQTPFGAKASRETVSRVIANLRMTRWVSLVAQGRDEDTGRLQGSMYILHSESISVQEAVMIDPSYADLVCKNLNNSINSARAVAQ